MRKIKNKRAEASLMINKTILIILVVLTVLVVLMAWFKSDILNWIKNLPGYGSAEGEDRVIDPSYLAAQGYTEIGKVQRERISGASAFNEFYITIGDRKTYLYWPPKEFVGKIKLAVSWGRDIELGEVKAFKAEIYRWYLFDGPNYQELVRDNRGSIIPTIDELKLLDGTEYYSGTLWKKQVSVK